MSSSYVSVGEPIGQAWQKMMKVCFRPFDIGKWFSLGFCAWLASLGERGVFSGGGGRGSSGGGRGGGAALHEAKIWLAANIALILIILGIVLVVGIALSLFMTWLRSRGKFMFLDGVVHDRGLVVQPWHEFREQGNSLFCFNIVFGLIASFAVLVFVGGGVLIALPDIQQERLGPAGLIAIIATSFSILGLSLIVAVIRFCMEAFVIPLMYLRHQRVMAAWQEFQNQLLPGHLGAIVLFFLLTLVLGIASSFVVLASILLTCCLGCCLLMLPYIGTVVMLPILVFFRAYFIYFFQQFGPEYQLMSVEQLLSPPRGFPVVPGP